MSEVLKSASSGWISTRTAFLKPMRSNALFHSSAPSRIAPRYFSAPIAVDPVDDRHLGFGQFGRGIAFFQAPAIDVAIDRNTPVIGGEIPAIGTEITDPVVSQARPHRYVRQLGQRIVKPQEQAAYIRHRRWGLRVELSGHGTRHAAQRVVRSDVERNECRRAAYLAEERIARVERIRLAIDLLQAQCRAHQVREKQRVCLHQYRFTFGVRLRHNGGAGEQAIRKAIGNGARLGSARLRRVLHVPGDELNIGADLAKVDDERRAKAARNDAAHGPGEEAVLAQSLVHVRGKEVGVVKLVGPISSHTLSSFCHTWKRPGSSLASRLTSANERNVEGVGAAGVLPGAPARRCALAIACGDGATTGVAPGNAVRAGGVATGGASGTVAQPARMHTTTIVTTENERAYIGRLGFKRRVRRATNAVAPKRFPRRRRSQRALLRRRNSRRDCCRYAPPVRKDSGSRGR